MDASDPEVVPEKEKIEDGKEAATPAIHCELYDMEIVHKITQLFLPGLSAACVDNTTGGVFRSPGAVAMDIKKEMIDYLTQRSESFVAESVILEGGPDPETELFQNPYDIISDFIEDFASSKRNFFSRVSGWLLSDSREDKVDDFVQEMEMSGFWLMDRRELLAQTLLKNVDFKNAFHCNENFSTSDELLEHVVKCGFRTKNCRNDGCTTILCANHMEHHDSVCPFKVIPCEQKCSDHILRREMDRHCLTLCPMKLVNCPFYAVGCQSTVPQCKLQQHRSDDLHSHLLYVLKGIHKGASMDDLRRRADQLVQSSTGQLAEARDVRSLTLRAKDIEAKLGPLEVNAAAKKVDESTNSANNSKEEPSNAVNKVSKDTTETPKLMAQE